MNCSLNILHIVYWSVEFAVRSTGRTQRSKGQVVCGGTFGWPFHPYKRAAAFLNNTVCLQRNGAVSKVNKKFISHLTRAQRTPSVAATVQVSPALPAVRFSCLLRGRGVSFQDGAAAGRDFLCAPF